MTAPIGLQSVTSLDRWKSLTTMRVALNNSNTKLSTVSYLLNVKQSNFNALIFTLNINDVPFTWNLQWCDAPTGNIFKKHSKWLFFGFCFFPFSSPLSRHTILQQRKRNGHCVKLLFPFSRKDRSFFSVVILSHYILVRMTVWKEHIGDTCMLYLITAFKAEENHLHNAKSCFLTEENEGTIHECGIIVVCAHDNVAVIDSCVRSIWVQ